ncbi:MAG: M48 family metallopeptidase [Micropruina sp.]|uniref:M48 family metallopeptidase n=1 Tax=Micropruina sp. TaxID=2737536 RepID=UPI0039E48C67
MSETSRIPLPSISSRAWEHPADRGALVALRKLRGFDVILRQLSGFLNERAVRMLLLGSAVRADERQFARVYRLYREAGEVLDAGELPELFIRADPAINALTIGLDHPVIVVNSGMVDVMDDDELRFALGHELGHVLSGHAVYRTLLSVLLAFSTSLFALPLGALGVRAVMAALLEWQRKSELSADRAGLLADQQPEAALRAHMKMASGGRIDELDAGAFLAQAGEYHANDDVRDVLLRVLIVESQTHPFAVVRAAELDRWVRSGGYQEVLDGQYPRRDDDPNASISAEASAAARHYGEEFARLDESLGRIFADLGQGLGLARDWLADRLRDLSTPRPRDDRGRGDRGRDERDDRERRSDPPDW